MFITEKILSLTEYLSVYLSMLLFVKNLNIVSKVINVMINRYLQILYSSGRHLATHEIVTNYELKFY